MQNPPQGTHPIFTATVLSIGVRRAWATLILLAFLLLLVAALAIPFLFESSTMWYKFGWDKTSLRTGKMLGMAAGLLLLIQLPLAGRLTVPDRIFSLPGLMRQHRLHAWAIALLALIHPLCVLLPEGRLIIPLEMRYWPEWVGVGLLAALLVQFAGSQWRQQVGIPFHRWLPVHRIAGLTIVILLVVHVLYVSETFTQTGPPRLAVLIAAAIFGLTWLWVRSAWLRARRKPFVVSCVQTTGSDSTRVELTPATTYPWAYIPGQFAVVSFRSAEVSAEPHAFTLSSSPSRPESLQFTIRACGDWTRTVKRLSAGDRALLQGPFGHFSHRFTDPHRELILIAGGIGITPMLSMLRHMADHRDTRPVTLIWSNRSRERVIFADEMDRLERELTGLRRIPIFTRVAGTEGQAADRLNHDMLESMLSGCSRYSAIFVCGPPQMMKQIISDLKRLGFAPRAIYSETFDF